MPRTQWAWKVWVVMRVITLRPGPSLDELKSLGEAIGGQIGEFIEFGRKVGIGCHT